MYVDEKGLSYVAARTGGGHLQLITLRITAVVMMMMRVIIMLLKVVVEEDRVDKVTPLLIDLT